MNRKAIEARLYRLKAELCEMVSWPEESDEADWQTKAESEKLEAAVRSRLQLEIDRLESELVATAPPSPAPHNEMRPPNAPNAPNGFAVRLWCMITRPAPKPGDSLHIEYLWAYRDVMLPGPPMGIIELPNGFCVRVTGARYVDGDYRYSLKHQRYDVSISPCWHGVAKPMDMIEKHEFTLGEPEPIYKAGF